MPVIWPRAPPAPQYAAALVWPAPPGAPMIAVRKWPRAKMAKPNEPAHVHLFFPRDDLGNAAKGAWKQWRADPIRSTR